MSPRRQGARCLFFPQQRNLVQRIWDYSVLLAVPVFSVLGFQASCFNLALLPHAFLFVVKDAFLGVSTFLYHNFVFQACHIDSFFFFV